MPAGVDVAGLVLVTTTVTVPVLPGLIVAGLGWGDGGGEGDEGGGSAESAADATAGLLTPPRVKQHGDRGNRCRPAQGGRQPGVSEGERAFAAGLESQRFVEVADPGGVVRERRRQADVQGDGVGALEGRVARIPCW